MARKETPDVLGELLVGVPSASPTATEPPAAPAARKPRAARAGKGTLAKAEPPAPAAALVWDYLVISFGEYRGWRPRYINGQEIRNWMQAPLIHDYVSLLGEDGWEMVGAGGGRALYGTSDYYQTFFKRPKR